MQANEFEKKVQLLMDEFRISPSTAVWPEVERRIQEKKRKRRVLFFIVFSSIGLALAGYGIYNSSHHQSNSRSEIVPQEKITSTKPTPALENSASVTDKNGTESIAITKQQENEIAKTKTSIPGQKEIIVRKAVSRKSESIRPIQPADKYTDNPTWTSAAVTDNSLPADDPRATVVGLDKKTHADQVKENISRTTLIDSTLSQILQSNTTGQNQTGRISKRLQWGMNFSAGSSVITNNHFSFKNSASLADVSYSSPGTSSTGGAPRLPASLNESVFAFKAGIAAKKDISLRSQLSVGLQYAYLGDHIKAASTSTQANSQQGSSFLFSSYYSAAPQKTHEDRFHLIELPILYHWRISKNDKRFLSLNAGVSAGYLLGSNALIYDTSYRGIYFHDESLLTKTHFNVISGISYHLAGVNGLEWSIGPQIFFDLSRIIKSDIDKRRYLIYAGIDTRFFLDTKKKK